MNVALDIETIDNYNDGVGIQNHLQEIGDWLRV